jgi:hypothetical protein
MPDEIHAPRRYFAEDDGIDYADVCLGLVLTHRLDETPIERLNRTARENAELQREHE